MQGLAATDPRIVAEQAQVVATAWSPRGAPSSWALTAAQFEVLRDDRELLEIAATIPPDRLPPLLFEAAATFLVLTLEPSGLRDYFPRLGAPQPPVDVRFRRAYRAFCLEHREQLLALCASHRYQMNEVGRCAAVIPALFPASGDGREIVLIDLGTGAGLALHLDRYRYEFRESGGGVRTLGDASAAVKIETELRGADPPPMPLAPPRIVDRVGIDIEPLDLGDDRVRSWLAACIPQEIGAVTRFHQAAELAIAASPRTVRGDVNATLPTVLDAIPEGPIICLLDTYVHVFFERDELRRFRELIALAGAHRDLDWITIDPLVPLGPAARECVLGIDVPQSLVDRNHREGVFGLVGRLSYRDGRCTASLLGVAHPGAAWLEWTDQ